MNDTLTNFQFSFICRFDLLLSIKAYRLKSGFFSRSRPAIPKKEKSSGKVNQGISPMTSRCFKSEYFIVNAPVVWPLLSMQATSVKLKLDSHSPQEIV